LEKNTILADSLSIIPPEPAMNFTRCPKCGHAPLPARQESPAACPACGVIFAKWSDGAPATSIPGRASGTSAAPPGDAPAGAVAALLFHVPAAVDKTYWLARLATFLLFSAWTAWIFAGIDIRAGEIGSHFLWAVLTPFHEAGHYLIFRWFGTFIMTLGGTLGQHLMPLALAGALLWKRRDPFGAALFTWLLGFSVVMMAAYMYDAFDPRMMLLDGRTGADSDGHDWQNIFGDMGLLRRARGIGVFFGIAGRGIMLAGLAWAGWMVWLQRQRLSDNPFAESDADA
jgi:hypothetical protein